MDQTTENTTNFYSIQYCTRIVFHYLFIDQNYPFTTVDMVTRTTIVIRFLVYIKKSPLILWNHGGRWA